ncbi:hypothetical protein AB0B52_07995 [Streptomyces griseofuscus]|uniref:hypothetical protein n=1 Tax=Streptomyces griseofuscus TaxID=146922 RepID=UPI0033D62A88
MEFDVAGGRRRGLLAGPGHGSRTGDVVPADAGVHVAGEAAAPPRPGGDGISGREAWLRVAEGSSLLVALDFLRASEVLSQPFRLDFEHAGGRAWHIPDFLAVIGGGMWLLDVRPMELIKEEDALKFAAAREVAAACGWRYSVVAGWRPHVWSVLDHLSSRRRPARDLLGMREQLLTAISGQKGQAMTFSDLAEATSVPSVGRANIVRLLWHRELSVDLGSPLRHSSLIWAV